MLRALMTEAEAKALVASMADMEELAVENEKRRREEYRNALREGTPLSLARLIKTVYIRKKRNEKTQKRIYETDTEFDKTARRALLGEIAHVLGIGENDAQKIINDAMDAKI